MAPMGRQWFNLTFRDPGEMTRGVAQAGPVLDAFLAAELERLRLPSSALGLVGFSQGTMIALAVGLTRTPPPAAIVGYSGALANAEAMVERQGAGPAVLLVHGDMDEVIPVDAMLLAREQLAQGRASGRMACGARTRPWHRPDRAEARRRLPQTSLRRRRYAVATQGS